ncbi:MAG: hypothetical protein ACR2H3_16200 [Acidimicrobiales bacterium]
MMLAKAPSIIALLEALDLDRRGWEVVDHWDADECALGIAGRGQPRRLVYVSTFQRGPERYDYECEVPGGPDIEQYEVTIRGEDVCLETLVAVLESHLLAE